MKRLCFLAIIIFIIFIPLGKTYSYPFPSQRYGFYSPYTLPVEKSHVVIPNVKNPNNLPQTYQIYRGNILFLRRGNNKISILSNPNYNPNSLYRLRENKSNYSGIEKSYRNFYSIFKNGHFPLEWRRGFLKENNNLFSQIYNYYFKTKENKRSRISGNRKSQNSYIPIFDLNEKMINANLPLYELLPFEQFRNLMTLTDDRFESLIRISFDIITKNLRLLSQFPVDITTYPESNEKTISDIQLALVLIQMISESNNKENNLPAISLSKTKYYKPFQGTTIVYKTEKCQKEQKNIFNQLANNKKMIYHNLTPENVHKINPIYFVIPKVSDITNLQVILSRILKEQMAKYINDETGKILLPLELKRSNILLIIFFLIIFSAVFGISAGLWWTMRTSPQF
jgi:hypothetical protein